MESFSANKVFELATDIVSYTTQNVFLTGKAGTGKTTFLHHIRQNIDKNVVVAAPTGVAAINAGGVTLHSFLQLPFEPFLPNAEGKKKLEYHFKLRKTKIEMLQELELLIIDEVSMLRADVLDAIDYMLRRCRGSQLPFGGVQVLFIGDMFQLPPVVQPPEWELLRQYYPSPFFFHAHVLQNHMPLYIELKKIYRQQDQQFIDILNRIRNNCATTHDLQELNRRYDPDFKISAENKYIVLCTHNYKADRINSEELTRLANKEFSYQGKISGDFANNALPTEATLTLKVGAQVMFVKNDTSDDRRYYNGKLATIVSLDSNKIRVRFRNDDEIDIETETWRNVRYTLNNESGEIEEEELGAFTQYPIRLAWAITIHKSQGLTFDRVVIDAGQAFAGGQVYVALSRCTTLDGIVLFSRITPQSIQTDPYALSFAQNEHNTNYLLQVLELEKPQYCAEQLKKYFDWTPFVRCLRSLYELATEKKIPKQEETQGMIAQLCNRVIEQQEFALNFRKELDRILSSPNVNNNLLKERVQKAALYFHQDVQSQIILPVERHIMSLEKAAKVKLYLVRAKDIRTTLYRLLSRLEHICYGNTVLTEGLTFPKLEIFSSAASLQKESENKGRIQKGDTQRLSLSLFNEGKNIEDIALERNLNTTTVEGHLLGFVLSGELPIGQLVSEEKIAYLLPKLSTYDPQAGLKSLKDSLPEYFSYTDIKAVLNYIKFMAKKDKIQNNDK